jgi:hypothetical protein
VSDGPATAAAGGPAAAAADPDRPRRLLEEVLARPEFHGGEASPGWLSDFLDRLFGSAGTVPDWLGAAVTAAIGIGAVLLVAHLLSDGRVRRARRAGAGAADGAPAAGGAEPARELHRRGAAAARAGRHAEAVVLLFRAILARLIERRLLLADPSRTNREHLRDLRARPREAAAVRAVMPAFERIRYGGAAAGPEEATLAAREAAAFFPDDAAEGAA